MLPGVYKEQTRKIHWESALAQPLIPGLRVLVYKRNNKILLKYNNKELTPPVFILKNLNKLLSNNLILDGILFLPDYTPSKLARLLQEPTSKLKLYILDLVSIDSFVNRFIFLEDLFTNLNYIKLVNPVKVRSEHELMLCQKDFIFAGYPGALLRHRHHGYEPGVKSNYFLEVNTFRSNYFKVIDYKASSNTSFIVTCTAKRQYFDAVLNTSILKEYSIQDILGKTLLVKYHSFGSDGPTLPVAVSINF